MDIQEKFRTAMRGFFASVSVMALKNSNGFFAITVSSVTSISLDPPSLLVCINKDSRIHSELLEGKLVSINLLTKDQQHISEKCSNSLLEGERFDQEYWDIENTPIVKNAQANFLCKISNMIDHGTHSILLLDVQDVEHLDEINTLSYINGKYV